MRLTEFVSGKAKNGKRLFVLGMVISNTWLCRLVYATPQPRFKLTSMTHCAIIWMISVLRTWTMSWYIQAAPSKNTLSTFEKSSHDSKSTAYLSNPRSANFMSRKPSSLVISFPLMAFEWTLSESKPLSNGQSLSRFMISKFSSVSRISIGDS